MQWTHLIYIPICWLLISCSNLSVQSDSEKVKPMLTSSTPTTCELRNDVETNNLDALHRIVCLNLTFD